MLNRTVQVSITTRDRWPVLAETLAQLRQFGLGAYDVAVVDDGSVQPCPYDIAALLPSASLQRYEEAKGLIVRRNQLMRRLNADFVLQVDDDSFPVAGSLAQAVAFLTTQPNALAATFPVHDPVAGVEQVKSLAAQPYQTKAFIGCAALINRAQFLRLGGYRDELVHFMEERDVAARGFRQGCVCFHYPQLRFYHVRTPVGRNWTRMDFYGARNNVLWNDWYVPDRLQFYQNSRLLVSRFFVLLRTRRWDNARGHVRGIQDRRAFRRFRRRMSAAAFREWRRLPDY
ncbi:MAG: glycosyltransferase family 2 protein [Ardenticatenales bacterium]|nr:glycosyltransferase family 2 protein [Ardenticatenales bacterium]